MLTWSFSNAEELATWIEGTNGVVLARDGDNTVTMAEFSNERNGHIIAIGDPAFEWNRATATTENISNLFKLTTNTISYLIQQSAK